jgi:hypothetical protein
MSLSFAAFLLPFDSFIVLRFNEIAVFLDRIHCLSCYLLEKASQIGFQP